jgi:hypothetical protein
LLAARMANAGTGGCIMTADAGSQLTAVSQDK